MDAGPPQIYTAINRPHPETTFERVVEGLSAFRREYTGSLQVGVMLVRGLNDTEAALEATAAILSRVSPDVIHINLPTAFATLKWPTSLTKSGPPR